MKRQRTDSTETTYIRKEVELGELERRGDEEERVCKVEGRVEAEEMVVVVVDDEKVPRISRRGGHEVKVGDG